MTCIGGCGKTLRLNAFQQKAAEAGVFKSWKCADCAARDARIDQYTERLRDDPAR